MSASVRRAIGAVVCAVVLIGLSADAGSAAGQAEPFIGQQWGLTQIGAQDAWTVTRGAGVKIGVIDTGVDLRHEELAGGAVLASARCIDTAGRMDRCTGSAQDDNGHGTHVAGTLAAPLNGKGVAGVAPEAGLLVVKALDKEGGGEAVDVAAAIDWVVSRGATVVNLSLADATAVGQVLGSPIETAIRRWFAERGVVFVLAGGNRADDGSAPAGAKAGYGDLPALVVAATGPDGRPARYNLPLGTARWGLAAPGGDGSVSQPEREIVSTYWYAQQPNGYAWSEGTSMAAPHVAATAALLTATGVKGQAAIERIMATLRPLDCGAGCRGSLDARAAVGARPGTAVSTTTTAAAAAARTARATRTAGTTAATATPTTAPPTTPTTVSTTLVGEEHAAPEAPALALPVARDIPSAAPEADAPVVPGALAGVALLAVTAAAAVTVRRQTSVRRTVTTLP